MKTPIKKYPFLISLIISFAIVVASIFVVAFCGLKLNPSLGGGSQFEISITDDIEAKSSIQKIKDVLEDNNITYDSFIVEDKANATDVAGVYSQRYIVVNVIATNVSDEVESKVRTEVASKLGVSIENVSGIENIISSIKSKDILLFGLGIAIIAICLFVFGLIRYDVFAGIAFFLSILHNIILFLSIMILTRIPLGLISIAAIAVLSLILSAVLVSIFEKNKLENETHLAEKETPSERLIKAEISATKPYIVVLIAVLLFTVMLFFVPLYNVIFSALSILISVVVTLYTTLLVGPSVYGTFLDIKQSRFNATLSRNDSVNKVIKKKIAKSKKASK
ncbi:MAG: hypothetical protein IKJ33_03370 [Clostridia bacterium]|nr:hypothetical protein [Clostridia bacterium]